ncbi:dienelactone hydrolase-like protein [Corynespora cassiicola Philippines]|uniref:Dienelactone hydrolase-like protein n=1 Tax=Corynespora cassiicola Philippines TaxID=1448308 RepID=A0A2T2NWE1_CORCC|nr:dienelactone hydrolase-like protein [Corynespora cassiicola Philippines]
MSAPPTADPPILIPSAPPSHISPHLTLQPPLSRRGRGPGLVIVVDHYAPLDKSAAHLDPPPLQKWAEEGFAVVQIQVPGKAEDGGEFPLEKGLEVLRGCGGWEEGEGVGLVSYLSRIPFYVEEAACLSPAIKAIVSYGGKKFSSINTAASSIPPLLLHLAGPERPRRESFSVVPDPEPADPSSGGSVAAVTPPEPVVKSFRYVEARNDSAWMLPSDDEYHKQSAGLAHTRSLEFLKKYLGGPYFDLEAVWEEHCKYEFGTREVERTMATMVAEPYVNHIPTMTGGVGKERLTAFYTHHFIFSNPDDTELSLVSRTVGTDRIIDEFILKLTHDKEIPWLLPGIPPTNKKLELPFTSVVALRGDRLCHEHISWDQGTALQQLGLLPEWVPFPFSIDGKEAASGKRFEVKLPVAGKETSDKLADEGAVESNLLMENKWREVDAA